MKKLLFGITAILFCLTSLAQTEEAGYIAPSNIKIADGVMTPETLLSFGRLSDPQLSPDGTRILYGVSYTSIDDNRQCRNLFVCNTDGSNKVQLTKAGKSISNARWSADGKSIFFLQGGQLWKADLNGSTLGAKVKLSDIPNGVSEFKLSPDQKKVILLSTIPNPSFIQPVDVDKKLDKAQAFMTSNLMYRHWDHWVTEIPRSYVADLDGKLITLQNTVDILGSEPFELPTEPLSGAEQLDWSPDGKYIAYSCRKLTGKQYAFSTNTGIYVYDVTSGKTLPVKTDGGYDTDPVWSPDGKHLAWISMERDSYEADKQRLMVVDILTENGMIAFSNMRDLTKNFKYDAASPVWNSISVGLIFSSPCEGLEKLFCVNLDGMVAQVTKDDWKFDFHSPFAVKVDPKTKTRTIYATYCSLNMPMEIVCVKVVGKDRQASLYQITKENEHILSQLKTPTSESVIVKTVDGKDMQCWIVYPPEFDSTKTYPAIEIALGGPQGSHTQGWSYRWNYRLMAQQGYIVIMPNRRGTTAFGQDWKEQISGDYAGLNMQDYLSAGRYIKSKPYVDKLACVGASYGGYSVYMLEGLHKDLYDCFIAHAGIFNEKQLWFTTEEMWFANWDNGGLTQYAYTPNQVGSNGDGVTFGGMQQAGAPYAVTEKAKHHYANDPSSMVTNWHTPILCIHGMMDFRIPYEQGMAAFNAAQMMGVPSKLILFPEETHWVLQPQNALFWHREFYNWLGQWVK